MWAMPRIYSSVKEKGRMKVWVLLGNIKVLKHTTEYINFHNGKIRLGLEEIRVYRKHIDGQRGENRKYILTS